MATWPQLSGQPIAGRNYKHGVWHLAYIDQLCQRLSNSQSVRSLNQFVPTRLITLQTKVVIIKTLRTRDFVFMLAYSKNNI